MLVLFVVVIAAVVLARPIVAVCHAVRVGRPGWRWLLPSLWASLRWRWLCRNAGLGYLDKHHKRLMRPKLPGSTAVHVREEPQHLMRWPRARFRVTAYGWVATVKTIPRVGREELATAAPWIADAWHAHRVTVAAPRPGRVVLTGLRRDPLATPFGIASAPPLTYAEVFPRRLWLGRDQAATDRHLALPGVTGITVTGLPGSGKTSLALSWFMQLAGSGAVAPLILDGKDAGDWDDFADRAVVLGDDLDLAEQALAAAYGEMQDRRTRVLELTGHRNAWHAPITPALPLLLVILDESSVYLDVSAHKGSPKDEQRARRMVQFTGGLIRRGRSVLVLVVLLTQQGTVDAFGSSQLRNNCGLSVAFGLRTTEGAVAALGEDVRRYPDLSPVTLQGPELVGVCTATLRTGLDPFTVIRGAEVTEADTRARAAAIAHLGRPHLVTAARPLLTAVPELEDAQ
jgi:DNA segregation ATPase FtsK/SpoIIIE, S-DNA-T family